MPDDRGMGVIRMNLPIECSLPPYGELSVTMIVYRTLSPELEAEPTADELIEKLSGNRGFFEPGEVAQCLNLGPTNGDCVRQLAVGPAEFHICRAIFDVRKNEDDLLLANALVVGLLVLLEESGAVLG